MNDLNVLLLNYLINASRISNLYQGDTLTQIQDSYDFIVVGGGTAGLVVASRLSEDPEVTVLVVEGGGPESVYQEIPLIAFQLANVASRYYRIHSPVCLNGSCPLSAVGRVLGGSSTTGGLAYALNPRDYDQWAESGLTEWSYSKLLPFIKKLEKTNVGRDRYRGRSGLLNIMADKGRQYFFDPLYKVFEKAATSLGIDLGDFNGGYKYAFGAVQATVKDGRRQSSNTAYIGHKMRKNLDILTFSHVKRIVFENQTAVGVEWERIELLQAYASSGRESAVAITTKAKKEVILSAGALSTPQVLMLSGVGPSETLKKFNIPLVANSPGVGQNFQDHIGTVLEFEFDPSSLGDTEMSEDNYFQWRTNGSGVFGANLGFGSGRFRTNNSDSGKDIRGQIELSVVAEPEGVSKMAITALAVSPKSRGYITLNSSYFLDLPVIEANFLTEKVDQENIYESLQHAMSFANSKPFKDIGAKLIGPIVADCKQHELGSRDWLNCISQKDLTPWPHFCCTASMGPKSGSNRVVDENLLVVNVQNLRVIDASVFPNITSADPMATVYIIAEKGAELIKKRHQLKSKGNII
ncbi:Glucose dehydrogenase -like protein [Halotydeus destructor]|nr:Glucose dehydrogenase -like protein [Halotydeus destructor]